MAKKEIIFDERGAAPCKWCSKKRHINAYPKIVQIDDLYYAQCTKCHDNDMYEYLAITKEKAIKRWNASQLMGSGMNKVTDKNEEFY